MTHIEMVKEWLRLSERAAELRSETEAAEAQAEALRRILWPEAPVVQEPVSVAAPVPVPAPVTRPYKPRRKSSKRKPRVVKGATMANTIREALATFGPMTATDIGMLVNRDTAQAHGLMAHMSKKGEVERLEGGAYALTKQP